MSERGQYLTLKSYVRRRNGVPLGGSGALTQMLRRSLGANSFTVFWQYWNPIFGYYLGKYVYRPARSAGLSKTAGILVTFLVSGVVHDLAASAVKQEIIFVCTPWFVFMAIGAIASHKLNMDISARTWSFRAISHVIYVAICLTLALAFRYAMESVVAL